MSAGRDPDLKQALRPVPTYERAVREVSRMFSEAGIRHALVGALGANAYRRRPRTTEDINFLVGDEAFQKHAGGFVTMRVPVIEFDGIDVDQVPLTGPLRVIEEGLNRAPVSDGVPIAPVDTNVHVGSSRGFLTYVPSVGSRRFFTWFLTKVHIGSPRPFARLPHGILEEGCRHGTG